MEKITATERLTLCPVRQESVKQLGEIFRDDTVKKTYMVPDLTEEAALDLAKRIATLSEEQNRYVRGIYLNDTLIGILNDVGVENDAVELGWALHPRYYNCGYATEAVRAAIEDLFEMGYSEVIAGAFSENPASIRVMEKAGMQHCEKTEEITYRGVKHNCIYYAIRRTV